MPLCRFAGSDLEEILLYPVTLGHGLGRPQRGAPGRAAETAGRAIVERLGRLSPTLSIEWQRDGFGVVSGF